MNGRYGTHIEYAALRTQLGRSAALWAGPSGVRVEPNRWVALSGARSVDYNVILCHGPAAGPTIEASLDEIAARKAPALIMLAGPALGDIQPLVDRSWLCVGAVPLMSRPLTTPAETPDAAGVIRLTGNGSITHAASSPPCSTWSPTSPKSRCRSTPAAGPR